MRSLSLIQALFLLQEGKRLEQSIRSENNKVDCLAATHKNFALAKKIAHHVLGRNLGHLPRQSKILFLLIEEMVEKQCAIGKIDLSSFRFTWENIRSNTGWSHARLKFHLNRLETLHYLLCHRDENKRVFQYELLISSKSVTTIAIDCAGCRDKKKTASCNHA